MDYIMPDSHLELLQMILKELVLVRDQEAVFVPVEHEDPPEPEPAALAKRKS